MLCFLQKNTVIIRGITTSTYYTFLKKNFLSKYIFKKHKNFLCVKKIKSLLKIYSFNSVCLLTFSNRQQVLFFGSKQVCVFSHRETMQWSHEKDFLMMREVVPVVVFNQNSLLLGEESGIG